eukprot:8330872-Pyramimonas_sp.AAC.2
MIRGRRPRAPTPNFKRKQRELSNQHRQGVLCTVHQTRGTNVPVVEGAGSGEEALKGGGVRGHDGGEVGMG